MQLATAMKVPPQQLVYQRAPLNTVSAPEAPPPVRSPFDPVAQALAAGIAAVWAGDYGGTIDLGRLAGPHDAVLTAAEASRFRFAGSAPVRLSAPGVRKRLYEHCLTSGTQFDVYRWINLPALATVWHKLTLPNGVRRDWESVLQAAGLLRWAATARQNGATCPIWPPRQPKTIVRRR